MYPLNFLKLHKRSAYVGVCERFVMCCASKLLIKQSNILFHLFLCYFLLAVPLAEVNVGSDNQD